MPRPAVAAIIRPRKILLNALSVVIADRTGSSMVRNPGRTPELNVAALPPVSGINANCYCLKIDANREKTMSRTTVKLATLAIGAAFAFAGPAFADKLKATLDGKQEVPANTSAGKGTADLDWDAASNKLSWKLTYYGLSGSATAA